MAAIGSPFGNEDSLAVGVVSATQRSITSLTSRYNVVDAIQIDAPINHGNSGGPLFDARGRVIGINAQIRSDSGTAEGVGFAVPINAAQRSMRQLVAVGHVVYAYVGVTTEDSDPDARAPSGLRTSARRHPQRRCGTTARLIAPAPRRGARPRVQRRDDLAGRRPDRRDRRQAVHGADDVVRLVDRQAAGGVASSRSSADGNAGSSRVRLGSRPEGRPRRSR